MFIGEGHAFKRQLRKLPPEIQAKVGERLVLLASDKRHPLLRAHKLKAPYSDCFSINITGDYRLLYEKLDPQTIFLRAVGTHHQLFGT